MDNLDGCPDRSEKKNKTKGDRKVVVTVTNFEHIRKWNCQALPTTTLQTLYCFKF